MNTRNVIILNIALLLFIPITLFDALDYLVYYYFIQKSFCVRIYVYYNV